MAQEVLEVQGVQEDMVHKEDLEDLVDLEGQ
jgi:hypothetical protein